MSIVNTVPLHLEGAVQQVENACSFAIRMLMEDTHTYSIPITPYKEGNLRTSVSKQMLSPTMGSIKWHAPYAEYQERGFTTGPVTHYTTPGTHAHFVEESVEQAMLKLPQYLRLGGLI